MLSNNQVNGKKPILVFIEVETEKVGVPQTIAVFIVPKVDTAHLVILLIIALYETPAASANACAGTPIV